MTAEKVIQYCADEKLLKIDGINMMSQLVEANQEATTELATWQGFLGKAHISLGNAIQNTGGKLGLKNVVSLVEDTIGMVTAIQSTAKAASDVITG